jgi:hypothetical protein
VINVLLTAKYTKGLNSMFCLYDLCIKNIAAFAVNGF